MSICDQTDWGLHRASALTNDDTLPLSLNLFVLQFLHL